MKPQPISHAIAAPRMNPRASAPSTRSGCFPRPHPASSETVRCSVTGSASSGLMSLKPTPGSGKSGTSRIFVRRSIVELTSRPGHVPQVTPEQELRQLLRQLGEVLELLDPRLPALGVPRPQRRRDDLLEQRRLAVGAVPERAQVPRRDPITRELGAGGGHVGVRGAVELAVALLPRLEQAELLQLLRELGRDPGALAELAEAELLLLARERGRLPPAARLGGGGRGQLLADPPERQELVSLQAEDRLEPLHVLVGVEPVAALRAPRREQALVLEVADLRDRDVRELRLQVPADGADRVHALAAGALCCGAHWLIWS